MLPRHRQILEYVRQHGDASVDALTRVLGVTAQTIHRDIRQFEDGRLLARYHGGVSLPSSVENIDYGQRQVLHIDAKRHVAETVARRVEPGRSLIINIGTMTEEVSKALVGPSGPRGLRVITNDLNVASILSGSPNVEVIAAGGLVRNRDRDIVGEATIDFMKQFRVDISIIGVSSIDEDGTLLDYDYREVRVTQSIIEQSREVWLVADHSKFGRRAVVRLGHISRIDKLFTDILVPEPVAGVLRATEVDVIVASETRWRSIRFSCSPCSLDYSEMARRAPCMPPCHPDSSYGAQREQALTCGNPLDLHTHRH